VQGTPVSAPPQHGMTHHSLDVQLVSPHESPEASEVSPTSGVVVVSDVESVAASFTSATVVSTTTSSVASVGGVGGADESLLPQPKNANDNHTETRSRAIGFQDSASWACATSNSSSLGAYRDARGSFADVLRLYSSREHSGAS